VTPQSEPSDRHLREIELAEYLYGSLDVDAEKQIRLHLDTCPACSELTNSAAMALPEMNSAGATTEGPALPEVFRHALENKQYASPDEGQLWRLRGPGEHGEIAALGAIVRREDDHVWVVPVTPDPQEATDLWAAQLRIANTDLVMAFWTSLSTPIGYEVLDVWLGWTDVQPLKDLLAAQRRGEVPPSGLDLGRDLDEELAAYRADLGVEFLQMQEARLVPDTGDAGVTSGGDVAEALTQAGWAPSQLKAVAGGMTSGEAADALSGNRQLTEEQLARVSEALGRDLAAAPASVDWRWARAVGYPTRRHRYERLAVLKSEDPWQFRCEIACHPAAIAARKSEGSIADWDQLAEQQLAALERAADL
jgi:hypothetical protein